MPMKGGLRGAVTPVHGELEQEPEPDALPTCNSKGKSDEQKQ